MVLLLLGLIGEVHSWIACPFVLCTGNLRDDICAQRVAEDTVVINDEGCEEPHSCSFLDILHWVQFNSSSSLPCRTNRELDFEGPWSCPQRLPLKTLQEGEHPKHCVSDFDCILLDGTVAECVCTPSTKHRSGLCRPDPSDALFEDYWEECEQWGQVDNPELSLYFYLQQQFSVFYMTPDLAGCAFDKLYEFQQLKRVKQLILNSNALVVTALALLDIV